MTQVKGVRLNVLEIFRQEDVGRNIVRMDPHIMSILKIRPGSHVLIQGKKTTYAKCFPSHQLDVGMGVIRMDKYIRLNSGVTLGEKVLVRPVRLPEVKKVVLAPKKQTPYGMEFNKWVKKTLMGQAVSNGDVITIPAIGGPALLVVVGVNPKEGGIVSRNSIIMVRNVPAEELEHAPLITYEDIGGLKDVIYRIREMIELPLKHPELFKKLGIEPPKGVLLYGPPGCGKTLLAKAVANESGAHFISINGPEIMSKYYGESERNLRAIFEEAQRRAPSIVFIDEIDSIAPRREGISRDVERRVVATLLSLMDGLESRGQVVVIGATNMPEILDPALRRPGRFDREIEIGVPSRDGRKEILQIHVRDMPLADDVDLDKLADITHGFVGADLAALVREAAMSRLHKILPDIDLDQPNIPVKVLENMKVDMSDFMEALKLVQPSALREIRYEISKVKWSDVGGLENVKQELKEAVELPIKNPAVFAQMGINPPKGVLLYGPPGCGKTLLAKAVAGETEANFISVKGPEIMSKWVGESEKAIREIFRKARQVSPCIVFIDELDSIAPRRGFTIGDSRVSERVISQLLTELDGIQNLEGVITISATNRPDILDPAILRPGRFDKLIYVPPPDLGSRLKILEIHSKRMPLDKSVDLYSIADRTEGYSGADLEVICKEAGLSAIRRGSKKVYMEDFEYALNKVKPSITPEMLRYYKEAEDWIRRSMGKIIEETRYIT